MSEITKLEPKLVWELFDAITRVPRPSKKEEKIREFLVDFAKKHNIDYQTDETSNVVMRVPGTKGYENRPCVILQSHMDMVCEKNSDTAFDFDKDPIRTKIVDGWVKAEGTTLGADDGIGMAAALAALLDPALEHGPLEALFTVDEETGLTGAFGLGKGMLTGRYLVNLDSEDEGVEIQAGLGDGDDLFGLVLFAVTGRYGDGCGARRSARIGLGGDCKPLLGFRGGEPVGIFGKRVLPVVVGPDSQLFFVGFGGSGREGDGF